MESSEPWSTGQGSLSGTPATVPSNRWFLAAHVERPSRTRSRRHGQGMEHLRHGGPRCYVQMMGMDSGDTADRFFPAPKTCDFYFHESLGK